MRESDSVHFLKVWRKWNALLPIFVIFMLRALSKFDKDLFCWFGFSEDIITQGPLKKWTEHSHELHLLKIHSRGSSYYTPGLDGGWFFRPWAFIIPKSTYQDLSNAFTATCFFKLLKYGHFWINLRFWLVWVELRKSKALSSLNFLQRHEKYQIGSCPQLFDA